jgi:hypothetical protein
MLWTRAEIDAIRAAEAAFKNGDHAPVRLLFLDITLFVDTCALNRSAIMFRDPLSP